MIERDWSKPLGLELVDFQTELDLNRSTVAHFKGAGVVITADEERLGKQYDRILNVMKDGKWRTLAEIEAITHDPQASISRQLRYMDDPIFNKYPHTKNRQLRGPGRGLFEYQIILNPKVAEQEARAYYHAKHPHSPDPLKG